MKMEEKRCLAKKALATRLGYRSLEETWVKDWEVSRRRKKEEGKEKEEGNENEEEQILMGGPIRRAATTWLINKPKKPFHVSELRLGFHRVLQSPTKQPLTRCHPLRILDIPRMDLW